MPRDEQHQMIKSALIVDDHPLFCDALSMTLKAMLHVSDIQTAASMAEAEEVLQHATFDVILLDLNLPDVNGLNGLTQLLKTARETPILVVSSMAEPRIIALVLRAGAAGFVPKHSQPQVFGEALEAVAQGQVYGAEQAGDLLDAQDEETDALQRLSALTIQQARILSLVCEGRLNKQIAYELSIAESTVKTHMTAILHKLGAQSRTQAVLIAQRANFSQLLRDSAAPD